MEILEVRIILWGILFCVFGTMCSTCESNAAPSQSVFIAQQQKAQPDRLRACELQIYALQDRVGKLEVRVTKDKRANEQVLIDLIKRTNNLYELLSKHTHKAGK